MAKYRCTVCNWVYDEAAEGRSFGSLPESYVCPVCGAPKSAFKAEGTLTEAAAGPTVADRMVEQLVAFGVKHVYGIPGDSNLPLIEALRKDGRIRFILTRHEETAAFMASAHGKMTGGLGVCISIAGPGSTNLITGLMDAATDRSPVLALVGQVPEVYLGSEAFQEIDQVELFSSFASFAETVAKPNQALKVLLMAAKYAYKGPGVSVLSTPTDVLSDGLSAGILEPGKRLFRPPTVPDEADLRRAAALIDASGRVVLFAGWGARDCGAVLSELSEKLKAPVVTTSRAKGVVDETLESSAGVLGSIGAKQAASAIKSADLIVLVGSGFRQANLVPPGVRMVQVDHDPTRVGKTFDVDVGLVGAAKPTLERLAALVSKKGGDPAFLEAVSGERRKHMAEIEADAADASSPLSPGYVVQALKRNCDRDAIICVDVGDHTYWFYKKFLCEGQRTFLSANMASMGFALPAALSAKLDFPQKQVVCVAGDGGFGMLMADFTTAVRERLAVKVVVFDDGRLKNISKEQMRDGYPEFGISFPNPDFAAFAASCGGEGFRVADPAKLDPALKAAFRSDKPCIVDVLVDPYKMAPSTKRVE
jgi:thiamine pyrophosphate-dependent acetolactate synthase large subunit-like protein/rubredoxin